MADPQPTQLRTSRQLGINRLESVAGVWFPAKGSARARRVLARFALAPHIDLDDEEQPGEADRPLLLSRVKAVVSARPHLAPAADGGCRTNGGVVRGARDTFGYGYELLGV